MILMKITGSKKGAMLGNADRNPIFAASRSSSEPHLLTQRDHNPLPSPNAPKCSGFKCPVLA
jgi:hypothetical protein